MSREELPLSWTGPVWAGAVPFALYVLTAGGVTYWLDSAEFTAAAIDLDIPHPPGHPVANLWGKLFTLLPFGPLPFRVALGQAAACALALACAQRAIARSLRFLGLSQRAAQWVGVGSAWLLAGSYGFWFQAVRPEVYALAAFLVCFALERLSVLATRAPEGELDARPFYAATLAVGLGLANHHFISVLALPAFLWPFVELTRKQGLRVFAWGMVTGLLGLGAYVYLPLRAARLPPMDLGHPVTPGALAWVVTARVYAKKIGSEAIQPLSERFADLAVILVENLRVPALLAMLVGSYLLARRQRTWRLAALWLSTAFVNLAGRAWLNPVRANPDVLGYMMPGFVAVVALAACGLALLVVELSERLPPRAKLLENGLSALALAAGIWALAQGYAPASLASFHAPDLFDEIRYRALPEGSRLVLTTPQTVFRHFGADAVEHLRPDVAMVPLPFLDYGQAGEQLARKRPELARVIRGFSRNQALDRQALTELSHGHRLLIELDTTSTLPLYPWLSPSGLFYEFLATPPSDEQVEQAAQRRAALLDWLGEAIGAEAEELETKRQLLWIHYTDALFLAQRGLRAQALRAAARGLSLEPQARELAALAEALEQGQGPLDISPFLVRL
ncbi:MAG: DUF2723 domain-containing protein [Myxococcales bacterium]